MIIAEQKTLEEIKQIVAGYNKLLVVGCGTCVTVCFAGGEKEVGILASELRMARQMDGQQLETVERTIQRQCEWEFVDQLKDAIEDCDAILSMGCGVGVQGLAERFPTKVVLPALNTKGMALTVQEGLWAERCAGCGNCVLDKFGGVCPIARCSKSLQNGPCGGSVNGKCEIDPEIDCGWQLVYDRMKAINMLDKLYEVQEIKDWSTARDGGPRRINREDLRL
ncbi:MAG: methylenetetrahydrofolate reductase C-terminal domain-containing protein [Chloroflexi bacterium]|nr:methylenetetrahydrofolate reductase C-terminal domain-containing protein [Chloroflexota bacterium]